MVDRPTDIDPRLTLAYNESVRAWALQSSVLDEVRSRSGVLVSAASVSSAFLGSQAVASKQPWAGANLAAIAVFGVVILLCIYVLWPAKSWIFVHNSERLIETYLKDDTTANDMYERMTIDNARYRRKNSKRIEYRFLAFRIACFGLAAEIILWLVALHEGG
jgi:hypothetical protein